MTRPPAGRERAEALERWGRWVKETCDLHGAEPQTGFLVAGLFTQALAAEWAKRDATPAQETA